MKANLVIVGSGIVGSSCAYHLAKLGWKDVLLIDKGDLIENPGSTSHAPGGVVTLSHNKLLTLMAQYASNLYRSLEPFEPYHRKTYNWVGGLDLATTERRWNDLKRLHGEAQSYHAEAELLSPEETKLKHPLVDPKSFVGAIFVKNSALVSGAAVSGAMQRDAVKTGGVKCTGYTEATDIEIRNGRVSAVLTNNPDLPRIECEYVLLATNIWGPVLGDKLDTPIPLLAYEHQYVITEPLPSLSNFDPNKKEDEVIYPTTRDLNATIYMRTHHNAMGIGNYWHAPRNVKAKNVGANAIRPFTPEDFEKGWSQAKKIMPVLNETTGFTKQINGMFAFPIDGMMMLGESKVKGLWTAVGSWLTHAGGVGKSVAEWMTHGETEWDMRQVNVQRFHRFQSTRHYVETVCDKNYVEIYEIIHPKQPQSKPRDVRLSPFHQHWKSQSANYTTFAGMELPNWIEQNAGLMEKYEEQIPARKGWASEFWSPIQGAEHLETRENVALFDLHGLSVFEVSGAGATNFVNYLCSNKTDVKPGKVVYTCWLTPSGGVKRDLAVSRLNNDTYWMFVGEGTRPQDLQWVNKWAPKDGSVIVNDISDAWTALGIWGPNARKVLQKVTSDDISNEAFPYFAAKWIEIGATAVYALRVSYAGELGWELHIPMDAAAQVFDALWEAGREFNMIGAGMGAFDSLRLEKGYRGWGTDVHTEYNAFEAGLGWTVKLDKGDFIGREACVKLKDAPLKKKLCCFTLDDRNAVLIGYEPIYATANGDKSIGYVTSANFGYSVGKFIGYGYLPVEHSAKGTRLNVRYFGDTFAATVEDDPIFDAKMLRLKA
jgi:glycine cleavage system aminomethyltransferase T/glycine/D-amino acid oxidase-like deaminating enzyme